MKKQKFNKFFVLIFLNTNLFALSEIEEDKFILGKSFFEKPWVATPSSTTARDGLGPLFNGNTCISCHPKNGRGGVDSRSLVVRLNNDKNYGNQISINAISGVDFEASLSLIFQHKIITYPDGRKVKLRKPIVKLDNLNYGKLQEKTKLSLRIAPALTGLGLVEKLSLKNKGRFTHSAKIATVKQQVANAAFNDMGLTNPLYPVENCTPSQKKCLNAPKGKTLDLTKERLEAISFYLKNLPPSKKPQQKNNVLFNKIGCAKCHQPKFIIAKKAIYPFSDFQTYDFGEGKFRTAPLWGIKKMIKNLKNAQNFLHDGRARTIEEAIIWHSGEAENAKRQFMNLPLESRRKIIKFIGQL